MNFFIVLLGLGIIAIGIILIVWYEKFKLKHDKPGLSFKVRTGGIGLVMIGFYLLAKELAKII